MMTSHIMCTSKISTDLYFTKQKIKTKNGFAEVVYSESVLIKHKENCLSINGKQSVILEKEIFENYFKQIPVLLKMYADFECNLRGVESYESSYTKIMITFLVVLLIKLFVLMVDLLSELLFIEVKMQLINLLKQFLRIINIAKK